MINATSYVIYSLNSAYPDAPQPITDVSLYIGADDEKEGLHFLFGTASNKVVYRPLTEELKSSEQGVVPYDIVLSGDHKKLHTAYDDGNSEIHLTMTRRSTRKLIRSYYLEFSEGDNDRDIFTVGPKTPAFFSFLREKKEFSNIKSFAYPYLSKYGLVTIITSWEKVVAAQSMIPEPPFMAS